jgi:glycosyltransferase involved in cell wall biosynthesis
MASGIPVVQPSLGAFPEIINLAGGGKTYSPNTPSQLAKTLTALLSDSVELDRLSHQGRKGIDAHFHVSKQVEKMVETYELVVSG